MKSTKKYNKGQFQDEDLNKKLLENLNKEKIQYKFFILSVVQGLIVILDLCQNIHLADKHTAQQVKFILFFLMYHFTSKFNKLLIQISQIIAIILIIIIPLTRDQSIYQYYILVEMNMIILSYFIQQAEKYVQVIGYVAYFINKIQFLASNRSQYQDIISLVIFITIIILIFYQTNSKKFDRSNVLIQDLFMLDCVSKINEDDCVIKISKNECIWIGKESPEVQQDRKGEESKILLQKYLDQIFPDDIPETNDNFQELIKSMLNDDKTYYDHKQLLGFKQNQRIKITTIKYTIEIPQILIVIQNIHNQYLYEQHLISSNKQKDQILKSITQDMKYPLYNGQILIENQMMEFQSKQKYNQQQSQLALFNIDMSLNLINSVLDIQKINDNLDIKCQNSSFNMFELVNNIYLSFKIIAQQQKKTLSLISDLNKYLLTINIILQKVVCHNDYRRLNQILYNLLNNAIKFTKENGTITLIANQINQLNLFHFAVKDTGIGMSQQIIDKIGLKYQTNNDQNMNSNGNGIGLYTAQFILPLLGPSKKFIIKSITNQGSDFEFLINQNNDQPCQIQLDQSDYESIMNHNYQLQELLNEDQLINIPYHRNNYKNMTKPTKQIVQKFNVLIVDDDFICLIPLKSYFKNYYNQFNVLTANSGEEALNIFKENNNQKQCQNIHLIITDVNMGEMSGYELTRIINELINDNYQKSFIIIASGNDDQEHVMKAKSLNVLQTLVKSIKKQEFTQAIDNFLQQSKEFYI